MSENIDSRPAKENPPEWRNIEKFIEGLSREQKPSRVRMIHEIFRSAVKLAKENPGTLNLKITATTLNELRYSFKTFSAYRNIPKITMFGSARVADDSPLYEYTKEFSLASTKRNYMIITGGGPGIMAAGNEGAGDKGFGLNIRLPFEQTANPFIDHHSRLIHYKYFFTRKLFLVKEAAAFAFFPGGFGTLDETFEVLTLMQTGKTNLIPVVFMEPEGFGFWKGFMDFMKSGVLKRGFISAEDRALYHLFHSHKKALDHIDLFYKNYHSMRFVKDRVVLRLKKHLPAKVLKDLNRKFSSLSKGAPFEMTEPLVEEINEPELRDLHRLVFPCDRKDFAGIRRLIDFINENTV